MSIKNTNNDLFQDTKKYKFTLTNTATQQIKRLMFKNVEMIGLRINIKRSGCAGLSYAFDKVTKKNLDDTDLIFEYDNNVKLFIPSKIIPIINGSKLDYVKEELSYTFKFKNPKARYLCGCGESFNI